MPSNDPAKFDLVPGAEGFCADCRERIDTGDGYECHFPGDCPQSDWVRWRYAVAQKNVWSDRLITAERHVSFGDPGAGDEHAEAKREWEKWCDLAAELLDDAMKERERYYTPAAPRPANLDDEERINGEIHDRRTPGVS